MIINSHTHGRLLTRVQPAGGAEAEVGMPRLCRQGLRSPGAGAGRAGATQPPLQGHRACCGPPGGSGGPLGGCCGSLQGQRCRGSGECAAGMSHGCNEGRHGYGSRALLQEPWRVFSWHLDAIRVGRASYLVKCALKRPPGGSLRGCWSPQEHFSRIPGSGGCFSRHVAWMQRGWAGRASLKVGPEKAPGKAGRIKGTSAEGRAQARVQLACTMDALQVSLDIAT